MERPNYSLRIKAYLTLLTFNGFKVQLGPPISINIFIGSKTFSAIREVFQDKCPHDFYVLKLNILLEVSKIWSDLDQRVKHLCSKGEQNSLWEHKIELAGRRKHTCSDILKVEVFLHPYEGLHVSMKWKR